MQQLFFSEDFRDCVLTVDSSLSATNTTAAATAVNTTDAAQEGLPALALAAAAGGGAGALSVEHLPTVAVTGADADSSNEKAKTNRKFILELQRTFCYLLESTSSHYDPAAFVAACHVLDLPYPGEWPPPPNPPPLMLCCW
jgi:hypothetical protein